MRFLIHAVWPKMYNFRPRFFIRPTGREIVRNEITCRNLFLGGDFYFVTVR